METTNEPRPAIRLALPNGDAIVLFDMLAKDRDLDEVNRNVVRLDRSGQVLWRIQAATRDGERQPFTSVRFEEAEGLKAYCWDGGEYRVDLETGEIRRGVLVR